MPPADIAALPVAQLAAPGCHLWLWVTDWHLPEGFDILRAWEFHYLAPIVWIKPSGFGAWFVHRTQILLFGYRNPCRFPRARFRDNVIFANPGPHSTKPAAAYELIEAISEPPRLELFARNHRPGWDVWGNEVECTITL